MDLIAKRKVAETWRDAVSARAAASGDAGVCVALFDRLVAAGTSDAEAAYRTLRTSNLLWRLDGQDDPATTAEDAAGRHDLPSV